MFFLVGEALRSKSQSIGDRLCSVCQSQQPFESQVESLWFCIFGIPLLPIEDKARYWRCEKCLSAYKEGELTEPSQVDLSRRVIAYTFLGYRQDLHFVQAREICLKLTGFDFDEMAYRSLVRELGSGHVDMVETVRKSSQTMNAIGKQQVLEVAFLSTYLCCDLEYEDRLRINLLGNALDVGLEFVEYSIQQTRKQNYYGVRRFAHIASAL